MRQCPVRYLENTGPPMQHCLPIKISKTFTEKLVARALRGHQTQTSLMAEPGSEHGLSYVGHHMTKTVAWSDKNHPVPNCQG